MENQVVKLKLGNDIGNHEFKTVIGGDAPFAETGELEMQPTAILLTGELPFQADVSPEVILKELDDNIIITVDSPSVKPGMYHVGRGAVKYGTPQTFVIGESKSTSPISVVGTLGILAAHCVKKDPTRTNWNVEVDMSIALPLVQFNEEEDARRYERRFLGEKEKAVHKVTLHLGSRRISFEITFSFVRCVQEGSTSVFALQFNSDAKTWRTDELLSPLRVFIPFQDGEVLEGEQLDQLQDILEQLYNIEIERKGNKWVDKADPKSVYATFEKEGKEFKLVSVTCSGKFFELRRTLHTDIGDGTTECPITEGTRILNEYKKTAGIPHGVGKAIDEALPLFNRRTFNSDNTRQDFSEALKNKRNKWHAVAKDTFQEPAHNECMKIIDGVKAQLMKVKNQVDVNVVYGGGSILFRSTIEPMLKEIMQPRQIFLFYVPEEYATTLNAWSLFTFVNHDIFKQLKMKYQVASV
ncbi:plasmid segregation protein ParM [Brevibacillus aydinogluensis]|jgi:plasmid segregation protein ParM|uniref:ParM/StbA family protein n=1 Tax=Brevibacillus aydinogluensis TaxID=927786 RepID=UPI0028933DDE|nr:hypothetical protein [Brevibacillus aydinogluensis]MDT3418207.1 plasmid segregation protein ParM [Brevibacillus aydinogluensis]